MSETKPKLRMFFDMEFTGLHQRTTPISLAIVVEGEVKSWKYGDEGKIDLDEKHRYFYAEFIDYDKMQIDEWLDKNVISHLSDETKKLSEKYKERTLTTVFDTPKGSYRNSRDGHRTVVHGNTAMVKEQLIEFFDEFKDYEIEMWSDCLSYDWMLFCEIFGGAFGIPKNIHYIPLDICTLFYRDGIDPDISREEFVKEAIVGIEPEKHNALWDAKIIKLCFEKFDNLFMWSMKYDKSKPLVGMTTGTLPTFHDKLLSAIKFLSSSEMTEHLANFFHQNWSKWMKHLSSKTELKSAYCEEAKQDLIVVAIPDEYAERWLRQMETQYSDLSEEEKQSDRNQINDLIAFLSSLSTPTVNELQIS